MIKLNLLHPVIICLFIFCSCTKEEEQNKIPTLCDELAVSYIEDILPIIENSCALVGCHDYNFEWGNFLEYADLKDKAESGILWIRISVAKTMPPRPLNPLNEDELELIKCWLDDGSPNN